MAAPSYNSHPLPAPPQQQQGQQQYQQQQHVAYQQPQVQQQSQPPSAPPTQNPREVRKSRGFSFKSEKSHKSHKSGDSGHHHHNSETSAEKESKRLHSKADPTLAISEAEPAAVAQMMGGDRALKPLSSIQHKDANGNPIADPDRSNPTRSRWERPLDTIRSFEAAIDGGYDRKSVLIRGDTDSTVTGNRRSSYYANGNSSTPRFPQESYYGGRRDSNMYDSRQHSYQDGYDGGRNRYSRMQSEPPVNRPMGRNVYPVPNNHRSYETVASGAGSGSYGEPAGYQTDPTSSENSSIDRRSPPKRQEPVNDYGINFGQDSSYQPPAFGVPVAPRRMENGPPPPRKDVGGSLLRKVSRIEPSASPQASPAPAEKRKSWLLRKLSKS